ncbi:MAG: TrkA family potassium uptake protein, partial [Helcococcus sp.]|nr:TrkA family potassium uptake protein [Helcococcus sp.]
MKQYTVIGLGRFGSSVARTLAQIGHEVVVVDIKEELVDALSDITTTGLIGDATNKDILKAAGVKEVDTVIICMTEFESSIMTVIGCKEIGAKHIVAKAKNDSHKEILHKIGADHIVVPERDSGMRLAHNLSSRNVLDIIRLSNDYEIIEILAPDKWVGKTLSQIDLRNKYGVNVLGITHESGVFIGDPTAATDIKPK